MRLNLQSRACPICCWRAWACGRRRPSASTAPRKPENPGGCTSASAFPGRPCQPPSNGWKLKKYINIRIQYVLGGAIAEWSKALLVRENKQKTKTNPSFTHQPWKNDASEQKSFWLFKWVIQAFPSWVGVQAGVDILNYRILWNLS